MKSSKKVLNKKLKASTVITLIIIISLVAYIEFEVINQGQDTTRGLEAATESSCKPTNNTQTVNETLASFSTPSSLAINEPEQTSSNSTIEIQEQPASMQQRINPYISLPTGDQNTTRVPIAVSEVITNNVTLSTRTGNQSLLIPVRSSTSTNYLAFNVLIDLNGTIARFLRESVAHNASNDGAIVMQLFNQTSLTWTEKTTVFNSSVDDRNFGVGAIDSNVYLFFTEINAINRNTEFGYVKSTDLTCSSWSDFNVLQSANGLSAYGKMVQTNDSTYLMPFYGFDGINNRSLEIWRSTDNGKNWGWYSDIYRGSLNFSEFDLTLIGNGSLIATIRRNFDCHLYQAVSLDDGFSWSNIAVTNLGFDGPTPYVNAAIYDNASGNLVLVGWNSAVGTLEISITPASTVLKDSLSYTTAKILDSEGLTEAAYPNIVKLANGNYLICYGKVLQRSTVIEPWQIIYSPQTAQA